MQAYSLQHSCEQLMRMIQQGKSTADIHLLHTKIHHDLSLLRNSYELLQIDMENQQQEVQSLKKKNRKLIAKIEKREEQCELLKRQMTRNKDLYEHKITKMTKQLEKRLDKTSLESIVLKNDHKVKSYKNVDIQCDVLNISIIKKLEQDKKQLFNRINFLEKQIQEQQNQKNSKQLFIQSLLKAMKEQQDEQQSSQQEDNPEDQQELGEIGVNKMSRNSQKNEDSTLDALSDKGSEVLGGPDPIAQETQCEQLNGNENSLIFYWLQSIKSAMIKPLKYLLSL